MPSYIEPSSQPVKNYLDSSSNFSNAQHSKKRLFDAKCFLLIILLQKQSISSSFSRIFHRT